MNSDASTDYDRVTYPSAIYPQTHPDRLATLGRLMGLRPAAIEDCRVLELGCGDAANLITMAYDLPGSDFVGFDLAARPIAQGRHFAGRIGLANVRLQQMDVLELPDDLGQFDYIIAHGLFSWVPPEVRERILRLCGSHLSAQGIAYISYNAYPGNYLRDIVRGLMRFHAGQFEDPVERVRQARTVVKFAADAQSKPGLWQSVLQQQADRVATYSDSGFFTTTSGRSTSRCTSTNSWRRLRRMGCSSSLRRTCRICTARASRRKRCPCWGNWRGTLWPASNTSISSPAGRSGKRCSAEATSRSIGNSMPRRCGTYSLPGMPALPPRRATCGAMRWRNSAA